MKYTKKIFDLLIIAAIISGLYVAFCSPAMLQNTDNDFWIRVDSGFGFPSTYKHEEPSGIIYLVNSGSGNALVFVPNTEVEKR